eukprot:c49729_g1_i1 orf=1-174(-)
MLIKARISIKEGRSEYSDMYSDCGALSVDNSNWDHPGFRLYQGMNVRGKSNDAYQRNV